LLSEKAFSLLQYYTRGYLYVDYRPHTNNKDFFLLEIHQN